MTDCVVKYLGYICMPLAYFLLPRYGTTHYNVDNVSIDIDFYIELNMYLYISVNKLLLLL